MISAAPKRYVRAVSLFDDPWPAFLDLIDTAPQEAMEEFYTFTTRLLEAFPPPIMANLDQTEREDIYHKLFVHCCDNDFLRLRSYQNRGLRRGFAKWVLIVAARLATDEYRKKRKETNIPDYLETAAGDGPGSRDDIAISKIRKCLSELPAPCELILNARYGENMPLDDIRILLGWPDGERHVKRVSDVIRKKCMRELKRCLKRHGIYRPA